MSEEIIQNRIAELRKLYSETEKAAEAYHLAAQILILEEILVRMD